MPEIEENLAACLLVSIAALNIFLNPIQFFAIAGFVLQICYGLAVLYRNQSEDEIYSCSMATLYKVFGVSLIAVQYAIKQDVKLQHALLLFIFPVVHLFVGCSSEGKRYSQGILDTGNLISLSVIAFLGYVKKDLLAIYQSWIFLIIHFTSRNILESTYLFLLICASFTSGLMLRAAPASLS